MFAGTTFAKEKSCKKHWKNKFEKIKSWKLISAEESKTLCGFTIKEKDQKWELVLSKDLRKPILPGNQDNLNADCEYSEPINNEWTFCGIGVFKQTASSKNEKTKTIKL